MLGDSCELGFSFLRDFLDRRNQVVGLPGGDHDVHGSAIGIPADLFVGDVADVDPVPFPEQIPCPSLQSPQFLYRVELGQAVDAARGLARPTGYEMATRLSYLLWGSMPVPACAG